MAINEQSRENLVDDATAFARRIQLLDPNTQTLYFFGLRADGGWSIFVGENSVYQFNADDELRRVYTLRRKYAAIQGKLCLLERDSSGGRVKLRQSYNAAAEQLLIESCLELIHKLAENVKQHRFEVQACFPCDDKLLIEVMRERLLGVGGKLEIAKVANVGG